MPIKYNIINTELVAEGWNRHTIELACDDTDPVITETFTVEDYGKPVPMQKNIDIAVKAFSDRCKQFIAIDTKPITAALDASIAKIKVVG